MGRFNKQLDSDRSIWYTVVVTHDTLLELFQNKSWTFTTEIVHYFQT